MKISNVIKELVGVMAAYGNIECQLQNEPDANHHIIGYSNFFIVPEPHDKEDKTIENICNIRSWPY